MGEAIMNDLDDCVELIRQAPINDETRTHLIGQSTIFALFLSDLSAGKLKPELGDENTVPSMLELITEFCSQVREIIKPARQV